jgi:hypothetical protein
VLAPPAPRPRPRRLLRSVPALQPVRRVAGARGPARRADPHGDHRVRGGPAAWRSPRVSHLRTQLVPCAPRRRRPHGLVRRADAAAHLRGGCRPSCRCAVGKGPGADALPETPTYVTDCFSVGCCLAILGGLIGRANERVLAGGERARTARWTHLSGLGRVRLWDGPRCTLSVFVTTSLNCPLGRNHIASCLR